MSVAARAAAATKKMACSNDRVAECTYPSLGMRREGGKDYKTFSTTYED